MRFPEYAKIEDVSFLPLLGFICGGISGLFVRVFQEWLCVVEAQDAHIHGNARPNIIPLALSVFRFIRRSLKLPKKPN